VYGNAKTFADAIGGLNAAKKQVATYRRLTKKAQELEMGSVIEEFNAQDQRLNTKWINEELGRLRRQRYNRGP